MTHSHVWQNNNQIFTSAKTTIKYSRLLRQQIKHLRVCQNDDTFKSAETTMQRFRSLLLCSCDIFQVPTNTLYLWILHNLILFLCVCFCLLARHNTVRLLFVKHVHPSNSNTFAPWFVPLCMVLSPQHPLHPMVQANEQWTQGVLILFLDYCRAVWHTNPSRSWSLGSWAT